MDSEDNGTINSSSHRKQGGNSVTAVGYRWKFQFGIDSTRLPVRFKGIHSFTSSNAENLRVNFKENYSYGRRELTKVIIICTLRSSICSSLQILCIFCCHF